jgi:hypothetical protein
VPKSLLVGNEGVGNGGGVRSGPKPPGGIVVRVVLPGIVPRGMGSGCMLPAAGTTPCPVLGAALNPVGVTWDGKLVELMPRGWTTVPDVELTEPPVVPEVPRGAV